jgi:carboxypeptidase family protein/TonB-dependent receptor-like protein
VIRFALALLCAGVLLIGVKPAGAQPGRARIIVTVVDPSGGVVPDATVTLAALDSAAVTTIPPTKSSDKGIATIENLPPGRYSVSASFPGFEIGLLKDIRLRPGDNKHVVVLPIQKLASEVTVGRDAQAVAADPRARFGTALTREQIDALSDDPAEMAQQLADMAGPNAVIRVDSFEGAQLPPKSQIKAIHITRDAFAAENHFAGGLFIDIITQPGVGALRGGGNLRLRDSALGARSPFATRKAPERFENYFGNVGGSLMKEKASFSIGVNGGNSYITPYAFSYIPGYGRYSDPLPIRQPSDNVGVNGLLDYALTRDQTLRLSVNHNTNTAKNLGVGGNDAIERAYTRSDSFTNVRIQEAGPLGRRFFTNTRLMIGRTTSDSASAVEAVTYRVMDARTTGGAQVRGGRRGTTFSLQSDLDYVRGIQSVRTGLSIDGGSYFSDDESNYLGTYLFDSPAALEAATPLNYTRRLGDSAIEYHNVQAAIYIQDDIRLRKNLTLSPGVRYEAQTHLHDYNNFGPRVGVSWAPFKGGKTSLRGSAGIFYDWLSSGVYEQSLRVNGFRQRELNIANPSFPDAGTAGTISTGNRYLLSEDLPMARNTRVSAGSDVLAARQRRVHLRAHDWSATHARREPQSSSRRRPPRSALRQHRPGRVGRGIAPGCPQRLRVVFIRPAIRTIQPAERPAVELETHVAESELLDRTPREQHRRTVQPARERIAGRRVGSGSRRNQEASFQHRDQFERAQEFEREHQFERVHWNAVHHYHRPRRQR